MLKVPRLSVMFYMIGWAILFLKGLYMNHDGYEDKNAGQ